MELKAIIVILLLKNNCQIILASTGIHWSYGDNDGPEKWPELFPNMCAGVKQSPIDIQPFDTVYNKRLTNFGFNDSPEEGTKFIAHNNGHSIQVDTEGKFLLEYGGLHYKYRISQFHFHWGNANEIGSEHTINGTAAPMEMHIVSWNVNKYSSMAEAATKPDGLAVLGILYRVSNSNNQLLEPLVQVIPKLNNNVEIPVVSPSAFLPNSPEKYYRYHGSLTTPRCYESVTWTVFKERQTITESQLNVFRQTLVSHTTKAKPIPHPPEGINGEGLEHLVNNFRPVQPLNGRVIQRSYKV